MPLFSNPDPARGSFAEIASRDQVHAADTGSIIAAILRNRYQQQEQFQSTLDQVGKVVGGIKQQNDTGALADYLQSHSPDINADDSAQISQMSPAARVQLLTKLKEERDMQEKEDLARSLNEAKTGYYNRGAIGGSGGGLTPNQSAIEERFRERHARQALDDQIKANNAIVKGSGFKPEMLSSTTGVHAGVGPQGEYVPDGYYALGNKSLENIVPADKFDEAHGALDQYNALLRQRAQGPGAVAPASAAPNGDSDALVSRAQQALLDPEATPQEKAQAQKILATYGQ